MSWEGPGRVPYYVHFISNERSGYSDVTAGSPLFTLDPYKLLTTEFTVGGLFIPHPIIASLEASDGSLCWQLPARLSAQSGPDTCHLSRQELKHLPVCLCVCICFRKAAYYTGFNPEARCDPARWGAAQGQTDLSAISATTVCKLPSIY